MNKSAKQKQITVLIVVLAALLALTGTALAAAVICQQSARTQTAAVSDNIITTNKLGTAVEAGSMPLSWTMVADGRASGGNATLELYKGSAEATDAFRAENLFPGDTETKEYQLKVSHKGSITVHFAVTPKAGKAWSDYKLSEVLKCKVAVYNGSTLLGETTADGLMKDLPQIDHTLSSSGTTTDTLTYKITVSLDTSVGNDYQDKDLSADFRWWVETDSDGGSGGGTIIVIPDPENPTPPTPTDPDQPTPDQPTPEQSGGELAPKTGDTNNLLLWVALAAGSMSVLLLLFLTGKRKKEGEA